MKKQLYLLIFLPLIGFSQLPADYYAGTETLSGYALKSKIHDIISKKIISYHYSDVGGLYAQTDLDKYYENDGTILDIYSEKPLGPDAYNYDLTQNISSASAEGQGWNKEHGMPQSTFYGIYPMYSDLHYLIPADAFINQRRSNYPYARNNGSSYIFSNGSKLGKSTTPGYTNTVYEPIDEFKGDVARYLLYFATRYEGSLNLFNHQLSTMPLDGSEEKAYEDWYITMLKDWNTLDPVSQKEIDRNNAIYAIENVRNPFIDHPEWVNLIWSETPDAVAPSAPTNVQITTNGESFATLNWQPSPDSDILGYKIYVNGVYNTYTKNNSVTIDRLTPGTAYNFTVKAYDKGYLLSPDSNIATSTTLAADNLAKDLMITKYIEGSTNNTALEITNKTGHEVNLNNYYLNIQFKSATSFYFSGAYELEGKIAPGGVIVIVNPKSTFANFAPSQGNFITNSTPMSFTGTNYIELAYGTKYLKTVSTQNYDMSYTTVDAVGFKDVSNTNGNVSLYRNANVTDPRTDFQMSEWTAYPSNYTEGLGMQLAVNENNAASNSFKLYPNPVKDAVLYIRGKGIEKINAAEVYDMSGKLIFRINSPFKSNNGIGVSILKPGVYVLKMDNESYRFIKN